MLSKVGVKRLRYYEEMDLLKGKEIDEDWGQGYQCGEEVVEVNGIFVQKELGFRLKEMGEVVGEDM